MALTHAAKGIVKAAGWAGSLPLALSDPAGVATARAVDAGWMAAPSGGLPLPVMGVLSLAALAAVAWRTSRASPIDPDGSVVAARSGAVVGAALFGTILAGWVAG